MECVKLFNSELCSLYELKPPITRNKMAEVTDMAIKSVKFYKHVVQSVEKFIQKCQPEFKLPGLYVIDSIVRESRRQFGPDKDLFAARFAKGLPITMENLLACPPMDKAKILRVLKLWVKNGVYPASTIEPLLDMAGVIVEQPAVTTPATPVASTKGTPSSQMTTPSTPAVSKKAPSLLPDGAETVVRRLEPAEQKSEIVVTRSDVEKIEETVAPVGGGSGGTGGNSNNLDLQGNLLKTISQLLQQQQPQQQSLLPTLSLLQLQLLQQQLSQQLPVVVDQQPASQPQMPFIDSNLLAQIQALTAALLTRSSNSGSNSALEKAADVIEEISRKQQLKQTRCPSPSPSPIKQHESAVRRLSSEIMRSRGNDNADNITPSGKTVMSGGSSIERRVSGSTSKLAADSTLSPKKPASSLDARINACLNDEPRGSDSDWAPADSERGGGDADRSGRLRATGRRGRDSSVHSPDCSRREDSSSGGAMDSDRQCPPDSSKSSDFDRQNSGQRSRSTSRTPPRQRSVSGSRSETTRRPRVLSGGERQKRSRSRSTERDDDHERHRPRQKIETLDRTSAPPLKDQHACIASTVLWISPLSRQSSESELRDKLVQFGRPALTWLSSGAFIKFQRRSDAFDALNKLNGTTVNGSPVRVRWAPGIGIKNSEFNSYWDIRSGGTHIPWERLPRDLGALTEGGVVDDASLPPSFRLTSVLMSVAESENLSDIPAVRAGDESTCEPSSQSHPEPSDPPHNTAIVTPIVTSTSQSAVTTCPPSGVNQSLPPPPIGFMAKFDPSVPPPNFGGLTAAPPSNPATSAKSSSDRQTNDDMDIDERSSDGGSDSGGDNNANEGEWDGRVLQHATGVGSGVVGGSSQILGAPQERNPPQPVPPPPNMLRPPENILYSMVPPPVSSFGGGLQNFPPGLNSAGMLPFSMAAISAATAVSAAPFFQSAPGFPGTSSMPPTSNASNSGSCGSSNWSAAGPENPASGSGVLGMPSGYNFVSSAGPGFPNFDLPGVRPVGPPPSFASGIPSGGMGGILPPPGNFPGPQPVPPVSYGGAGMISAPQPIQSQNPNVGGFGPCPLGLARPTFDASPFNQTGSTNVDFNFPHGQMSALASPSVDNFGSVSGPPRGQFPQGFRGFPSTESAGSFPTTIQGSLPPPGSFNPHGSGGRPEFVPNFSNQGNIIGDNNFRPAMNPLPPSAANSGPGGFGSDRQPMGSFGPCPTNPSGMPGEPSFGPRVPAGEMNVPGLLGPPPIISQSSAPPFNPSALNSGDGTRPPGPMIGGPNPPHSSGPRFPPSTGGSGEMIRGPPLSGQHIPPPFHQFQYDPHSSGLPPRPPADMSFGGIRPSSGPFPSSSPQNSDIFLDRGPPSQFPPAANFGGLPGNRPEPVTSSSSGRNHLNNGPGLLGPVPDRLPPGYAGIGGAGGDFRPTMPHSVAPLLPGNVARQPAPNNPPPSGSFPSLQNSSLLGGLSTDGRLLAPSAIRAGSVGGDGGARLETNQISGRNGGPTTGFGQNPPNMFDSGPFGNPNGRGPFPSNTPKQTGGPRWNGPPSSGPEPHGLFDDGPGRREGHLLPGLMNLGGNQHASGPGGPGGPRGLSGSSGLLGPGGFNGPNPGPAGLCGPGGPGGPGTPVGPNGPGGSVGASGYGIPGGPGGFGGPGGPGLGRSGGSDGSMVSGGIGRPGGGPGDNWMQCRPRLHAPGDATAGSRPPGDFPPHTVSNNMQPLLRPPGTLLHPGPEPLTQRGPQGLSAPPHISHPLPPPPRLGGPAGSSFGSKGHDSNSTVIPSLLSSERMRPHAPAQHPPGSNPNNLPEALAMLVNSGGWLPPRQSQHRGGRSRSRENDRQRFARNNRWRGRRPTEFRRGSADDSGSNRRRQHSSPGMDADTFEDHFDQISDDEDDADFHDKPECPTEPDCPHMAEPSRPQATEPSCPQPVSVCVEASSLKVDSGLENSVANPTVENAPMVSDSIVSSS